MPRPFLVVMTGLSGAGRSVALKSLEDLGYYCIDNLPAAMVAPVLEFIKTNPSSSNLFAIGLDARSHKAEEILQHLKKDVTQSMDVDVVFLTASEDTILDRYSTTRRKHPLLDASGQMIAAIRREAHDLEKIARLADVTFDTSQWSPHFLARQLENRYKTRSPVRQLHVTLTSFGFKYGMLRPCDMIVDVRFLKNPYFEETLRDRNGLDLDVQKHVQGDPDFNKYFAILTDYLILTLPRYHEEGKNYFRLGVGCTGGQHRSVTVVEKLSQILSEKLPENFLFSVHHRDIPITQ